MNKEDKELLQMQTTILNRIKEMHYRNNTFQAYDDSKPATMDFILRLNQLFFDYLRENGHPGIDEFAEVFKDSIQIMNDNALKNQFTPRQMVELLNTKYVSILGYMVGGNIDGQISRKVICEIIESSTNQ